MTPPAQRVYRARTVRRPRRRFKGAADKPPFRVPSMEEVRAVPWNGLTVASTFSGGGGSCLGYRMAGYRVLWANECDPKAWETYEANHPGSALDRRDIKEVGPGDVLEACGLKRGELDLLDGSPPCVAFSMAGKRQRLWDEEREHAGIRQKSVDLFREYIRLVDGVRPRVFVAENVYGMIVGKAKGHFKRYFTELEALGYRTRAALLDAQWLGVPQRRRRVIIVGVRKDLGLEPAFPSPLPYRYSIQDALPWIGSVVHDTSGIFSQGECADGLSPCITVGTNSVNSYHFKVRELEVVGNAKGFSDKIRQPVDEPSPTIVAGRKDHIALEGAPPVEDGAWLGGKMADKWDRLNPGDVDAEFFQLEKTDPAEPSSTIPAVGAASNRAAPTHPSERRKFSIAELRRICGFPDDYDLRGSYAEQWARLGNAVPPVMMLHIASAVRDRILLPWKEGTSL